MLESIDLSRKLKKAEYKQTREALERRLAGLQRDAVDAGLPVIIVFEGWDAAGKGTLINRLILPLDPRGFTVYTTAAPNEEEALRPFLWRFWTRTPARGRIAIFDRSWYRRVLSERIEKEVSEDAVDRAFRDIVSFERQLAADGTVLIKLFLHISKQEQKERFNALTANPATAWRVTKADRQRHRQYKRYISAVDAMLAKSHSVFAPWTVVEAEDGRFATVKILQTVVAALEAGLKQPAAARRRNPSKPAPNFNVSILGNIDLSPALGRNPYKKKLDRKQAHLRDLEHEIYMRRLPVIIVYEGWDAAGKGGNIKRLTRELDPRGYEVVPVSAPNDVERAHHYLWRFWNRIPKAGHMTIFDRSWYGRVLVERVEKLCRPAAWKAAYREINEMEAHLTDFGVILIKFWLQIDAAEQLRRFKERERVPHKQWKITEEDWRNRGNWDAYRDAAEEMLARTSPPTAPWTIVESNCKWFARIKALDTVIAAIEARLSRHPV